MTRLGYVPPPAAATGEPTADAHVADTSAAHAASAVGFTPTGSIAATDVQAALAEIGLEYAAGDTAVAAAAASALAAHEADTTNIHGIADTSALLTDAFPHVKYKTGEWYIGPGNDGVIAVAAQKAHVGPFDGSPLLIDGLRVNVTVSPGAGSSSKIIIYANGSDGYPGAKLLDVTIDTSTTGVKEVVAPTDFTAVLLPAGRKHFGCWVNATGSVTFSALANDFASPIAVPCTNTGSRSASFTRTGLAAVADPFGTATVANFWPRVLPRKA